MFSDEAFKYYTADEWIVLLTGKTHDSVKLCDGWLIVPVHVGQTPTLLYNGYRVFPGVKCGRGVLLTTHPLLVLRSWKSRAIPLPTLLATPGLYIYLLHAGQRDLPVVKISPEWVTGSEQGKSSGRIATFSLWTGKFRNGISSIPGE